jgi:hypothetical protein
MADEKFFRNGCFLIILGLSIAFLVYGFMELMRKPVGSSEANGATISRQLKGLAYIMLSQVVLVVGGALCLGGVDKSLGSLRGAYPGAYGM